MSFFLLLLALVVLGVLVVGIYSTNGSAVTMFKAGISAIKSKFRWTP